MARMVTRRALVKGAVAVAVASPLVVEAQPTTSHLIGFLHQGSPDPPPLTKAFSQGLSEAGIQEGRTLTTAVAMCGDMDMRFWLEQAQAERLPVP